MGGWIVMRRGAADRRISLWGFNVRFEGVCEDGVGVAESV